MPDHNLWAFSALTCDKAIYRSLHAAEGASITMLPVLDQVVRHGEVDVIYCRGRLVLGETNDLRDAALAAIRDTGQVVIHLGEVSSIDSSGLGLLAFLCISARKVAGDVKLVAPSARVAEGLKITKLGRLLDIYLTEQAALEAFTGPSAR